MNQNNPSKKSPVKIKLYSKEEVERMNNELWTSFPEDKNNLSFANKPKTKGKTIVGDVLE